MKNFIILMGICGKEIAIDIDKIDSLESKWSSDAKYYTRINIINSTIYWNVRETVMEIVKRINEVNNNINK